MQVSFIHLSDIHFGQERGGQVFVHDDVKKCLVGDAASLAEQHSGGKVTGIIVTGDIAYGGTREEYLKAGKWLDHLTEETGCEKTAVQVVPGNHDINWNEISAGCEMMLEAIIKKGQPELDRLLAHPRDREVLYGRFAAYGPFAEAYDCALDREGGFASDRRYELAPGRALRFIGLNTALVCSKNDIKGELLVGQRQALLSREKGEELVVLAHHPLDWLRDSVDVRRYVKSRARVFISGHEHNPSLTVDPVSEGSDLMMLAAGATVPPSVADDYTYTYNMLLFAWDEETDGLRVTLFPRAWSDTDTDFVDDPVRLGGHRPSFVLGCPNFRKAPRPSPPTPSPSAKSAPPKPPAAPPSGAPPRQGKRAQVKRSDSRFGQAQLRFFRDLSLEQRLDLLVTLDVLPADWHEPLTHGIERELVEGLGRGGRLAEFEAAIDTMTAAPAGAKEEREKP